MTGSGRDSPEVLRQLRRAHTQSVLTELRQAGALSRADLIRRSGLSRTTLTTIVTDLLERGVIVEQPPTEGSARARGRPVVPLSLNPTAGVVLGLDLAQRDIHAVIVNLAHEVVGVAHSRVAARATWRQRIDRAGRLVTELATERGIRLDALEAVGVGMSGVVVDASRPGPGSLNSAATRVVTGLGEIYDVPVYADNTSRLGALAEATWGAGAGARDVVYVRWSDGVGGGVVVDGQLIQGAHGTAGQIGHVTTDPDGPRCQCGGYGCLDPRIRIGSLLEAAGADGVRVEGIDELLELARSGDPTVVRVVSEAARTLGVALANLVVHLDPARVVVGGELATLGEQVVEPIRAAIRRHALPNAHRPIEVVPASLGPERSAMGAVALVLRHNH